MHYLFTFNWKVNIPKPVYPYTLNSETRKVTLAMWVFHFFFPLGAKKSVKYMNAGNKLGSPYNL